MTRTSLFCDVTQCMLAVVTDASRQPIGSMYLRQCSLTADKGTGRFSLNVGKQLLTHAASHPRTVTNSTTPQWSLKSREIRST